MVNYLDLLAIMINSGLDASASDRYPYQKHPEELHDDSKDYIELVNKLQRHT